MGLSCLRDAAYQSGVLSSGRRTPINLAAALLDYLSFIINQEEIRS